MPAHDHNLSLALAFLDEAKNRAQQESKKRNLDLLWAALQQTRDEGRAKYGISDVGAKLAKLGGMKTQSIRNDSGGDYGRLIELFRAADPTQKVDTTPLERGLALISDESLRASVKATVAEGKRLKLENDRLRALCGEVVIPLSANVATGANRSPAGAGRLSSRLRGALSKGISQERMAERGLKVNADGSISQGNALLFPPGFATAIEEILSMNADQTATPKKLL